MYCQRIAEASSFTPPLSIEERKDKVEKVRNEKVLNCLYPKPGAFVKLICFPWGGGGSNYFAKWGENIHDSVEVHSVRLAGRECRFQEPFATEPDQVVDEIVCALLPIIEDKPFAFFAHSMGAYLALLTALQLKREHKLEPMHLFLSSSVPLCEKDSRFEEYQQMTDEEARNHFLKMGGFPKDVVEDKGVFQQSFSTLKADGVIFGKFNFDKSHVSNALNCDLTCFMGTDDIVKNPRAWKEITTGNISVHVLPGNHFYFMETSNEDFIKKYIVKCLEVSLIACV